MSSTPPPPPQPPHYAQLPQGHAPARQASPAPAPAPTPPPQQIIVQAAKRSVIGRIWGAFLGLALFCTFLINIVLLAAVADSQTGAYDLSVLTDGKTDQEIAVVYVVGVIDETQAVRFDAFVRMAVWNDDVKAVVIRVNSPGGTVGGSNQIHDGVVKLKNAGKHVVVSMGDYAASGGYYVSAPADYIFAESTTITGSIGVVSIRPSFKGTLDKIGMKMSVTRAPRATRKIELNPFEDPTEQGLAAELALLDKMHQLFMDVVDKGRKDLSATQVEDLADGRVWLGGEAVANKLVDEEGDLDKAIVHAAKMAALKEPNVVRYQRRKGLTEQLVGAQGGLRIDAELLDRLHTPRIMMLWSPE